MLMFTNCISTDVNNSLINSAILRSSNMTNPNPHPLILKPKMTTDWAHLVSWPNHKMKLVAIVCVCVCVLFMLIKIWFLYQFNFWKIRALDIRKDQVAKVHVPFEI